MEVNASIRHGAGFQQHQATSTASRDSAAQSRISACGSSQMIFPRVFDIILTNDFLHWHEGIKVSQTSKECSRTWNYHSHRMLGEVLETLYKMAGRERSSWIIGYLKNDLHGFSRRDECELLTYYLNKSIRKLHSNFRMDQLNTPSALFPLDNIIVMEGFSRLGILEDSQCHRFPNRIAFARNLAFLASSQIQQYHGIDFDISNYNPQGSVPVLSSIIKRPLVDLVGEMIPFTDEKFVDFCRKYFLLSRAHCEFMGPVMIKKTFIMNPMMDFATTAAPSRNNSRDPSNIQATVHLPRDLEKIISPHRDPFQFISDIVTTAFGWYDDDRPPVWAQQPQHQQRYYVVDDDDHNNAFLRRYFLQQRGGQQQPPPQQRNTNPLPAIVAGLLVIGLVHVIGYDTFNKVVAGDQYPGAVAALLGVTSAFSLWFFFEFAVIRRQAMYSILGCAFILGWWLIWSPAASAADRGSP